MDYIYEIQAETKDRNVKKCTCVINGSLEEGKALNLDFMKEYINENRNNIRLYISKNEVINFNDMNIENFDMLSVRIGFFNIDKL
ncbi:hypothetical protein GCM10008904_32440 [Paraclostridium ghonii]|uniref:Uncharacterized protein n=1 Tax=Paraclostridium ghonii TaxID=29358 RepID=A0ABU0MXV7_9FIRM|nr:hypothetical protein [Paeniclostridium ghonii]MDQ0555351.1 hypothetical protein [Paeniclostridium ghonii]